MGFFSPLLANTVNNSGVWTLPHLAYMQQEPVEREDVLDHRERNRCGNSEGHYPAPSNSNVHWALELHEPFFMCC